MAIYNVTFVSEQQSQQSPKNVIYIDDDPSADDLLSVTLDWLADTGTGIPLGPPYREPPVSQTNYDFFIHLPAGELANYGAIAVADASADEWQILPYSDPNLGLFIYCLDTKGETLSAGKSRTLTLKNVGAQTLNGYRVDSVLFAFSQDTPDPPGQPAWPSPLTVSVTIEKFTPKQGLSPYPPLAVNFDTTNMVLCDGTSTSVLVLRIANQGLTAIDLDSTQTSFTLSFDTDADPDTTQRAALATPDQVNAFYIPGELNSSGIDNDWGVGVWNHEMQGGNPPTWKITPANGNTALQAGDSFEIPISNIVTGHPTGRALMHVQVQGLAGYSDQTFAVEIQKSPLLYRDGNIDFPGSSPGVTFSGNGGQKLSLDGGFREIGIQDTSTVYFRTSDNFAFYKQGTPSDTELDPGAGGTPMMVLKDGRAGVGTASPIFPLEVRTGVGSVGFCHSTGTADLATYINDQGAYLLTQTNTPLYFRANSVDLTPQLTLTPDGKLGIGTTNPQDPLQIVTGTGSTGLSHTDGKVDLATCVDDSGGHLLTQSNHPLYFRTNSANNGTPQLTLTTDGKLGIGTTSPSAALDVQGDGAISGKLGIGTTSPAEKLHVSGGNLQVDGAMKLNPSPATQGLMINGQPAMQLQTYTTGENNLMTEIDTGYPSSDWVATIAGFAFSAPNMDGGGGSNAAPYLGGNNNWWVQFGFWDCNGHQVDQYVAVAVLFIRRELVNVKSTLQIGGLP